MRDAEKPVALSSEAIADAALWLARLQSENRSGEDEQALRAWLAESDENRRAFMEVSASWDAVGGLSEIARQEPGATRHGTRREVLVGAAAVVATAVGGWRLWLAEPETYFTEVGELRRIALSDGTAMTLDTETEVEVRLTSSRRSIDLIRGRAHFDVARDRTRPFVVRADGRTVTALGTSFDVAHESEGITVVLVEGRVAVNPADGIDRTAAMLMVPGERLMLRHGKSARLDRPDLATAGAWQQGQLILEDRSLSEAVAEMNRYSRYRQLRIDDTLADRRISGSYATQNIESFARSVAGLIGGEVEIRGSEIVLHAGPPQPGTEGGLRPITASM